MTDELARLQRWVDAGAQVRILARRGERLTLALLTCDGGEEMERLVTADPEVARWCAEHAEAADGR
jgi:hypothetical protein